MTKRAVVETSSQAAPASNLEPPAATAARPTRPRRHSGGLRFQNYRRPFARAAEMGGPLKKQILHILAINGIESLESVSRDPRWFAMELLDVVDEFNGKVTYQLFLYPHGAGVLFKSGSIRTLGILRDHRLVLTVEHEDRDLREALTAAWAKVKKRISLEGAIDFQARDLS